MFLFRGVYPRVCSCFNPKHKWPKQPVTPLFVDHCSPPENHSTTFSHIYQEKFSDRTQSGSPAQAAEGLFRLCNEWWSSCPPEPTSPKRNEQSSNFTQIVAWQNGGDVFFFKTNKKRDMYQSLKASSEERFVCPANDDESQLFLGIKYIKQIDPRFSATCWNSRRSVCVAYWI